MKYYYKYFYAAMLFFIYFFLTGCVSSDIPKPLESHYIPVEITTVALGTIKNSLTLSGITEPYSNNMVVSAIPGRVDELNVAVGDHVKEGDILFTLESGLIEKQLEQAELALNRAYSNYQAMKVIAAQKTLVEDKELYQERKSLPGQYQQADQLSSNENLELSHQSLIQAQLAFNEAEQAYQATEVKAPGGGLVSLLNIKKGSLVSNKQPALLIVDMESFSVRLDVSENYINEIKLNDVVEINIPAVNYQTTGKVTSISPVKDKLSLLYPVKIKILNKDNLVKVSMYAEANIAIKEVSEITTIPLRALVTKNERQVVYVIRGNVAYERRVRTGIDNGTEIEVTEGLQPGEAVVISGQHYLRNSSKVKIVGE